MPRPKTYTVKTKVRLCVQGKYKLQENSERRAIINLLVANGGVMTFNEIDAHFGFDIRAKVIALLRAGWLEAS